MWQATGGDFHAGHKESDLVSAVELANDPFLNDIERWYKELEASPDRFKIAVVAYHWDGETYHYAPILASVADISEYGPLSRELFKTAYKKFVEEIPSIKPNILFSSLWVTDDDLDDVRRSSVPASARLWRSWLARTRSIRVRAESQSSTRRPPA